MKKILVSLLVIGFLLSTVPLVTGRALLNNKESFEGYTLFAPIRSRNTYLINNNGKIVHTWESRYFQALGTYLQENGNLIRSASTGNSSDFMGGGGHTGGVEILDWNGTVLWYFEYVSKYYRLHNDIKPLPNGNILMTVWEIKTDDEIIAAGCNPKKIDRGELWTDFIIEVDPTKPDGENIVWEWHVWDHLIQDYDSTKENHGVIADHPELIDVNYRGKKRAYPSFITDLVHVSSIDYIEEFDQVLISARNFNEIWIIDHNTTTEEAADHTGGRYGKGGDLLYRWGNPIVYGAGSKKDQILYMQHDACWVESGYPGEGHITIFNNGVGRLGYDYTSVEEMVPPVDEYGNYYLEPGSAYGPEKPIWTYRHRFPILTHSPYVCSAQRLPNGNTLICYGWWRGHFVEVTHEKKIVWRYLNLYPIPFFHLNKVFKVRRYPLDYPGIGDLEIS